MAVFAARAAWLAWIYCTRAQTCMLVSALILTPESPLQDSLTCANSSPRTNEHGHSYLERHRRRTRNKHEPLGLLQRTDRTVIVLSIRVSRRGGGCSHLRDPPSWYHLTSWDDVTGPARETPGSREGRGGLAETRVPGTWVVHEVKASRRADIQRVLSSYPHMHSHGKMAAIPAGALRETCSSTTTATSTSTSTYVRVQNSISNHPASGQLWTAHSINKPPASTLALSQAEYETITWSVLVAA